MALNPQQEAFVAAYLIHPNATAAARTAGYSQPRSQGSRLLKNVDIAARVGIKVAEVAMTPDEILRELGTLAKLKWQTTIDPRAAMQGKTKALELLGKYHEMWTDKVKHSGTVTFADLLTIANQDAGAGDPSQGE